MQFAIEEILNSQSFGDLTWLMDATRLGIFSWMATALNLWIRFYLNCGRNVPHTVGVERESDRFADAVRRCHSP